MSLFVDRIPDRTEGLYLAVTKKKEKEIYDERGSIRSKEVSLQDKNIVISTKQPGGWMERGGFTSVRGEGCMDGGCGGVGVQGV